MIPYNFNKMGMSGYKLIGIQPINGAYIDLGFAPEDDCIISFSAQAPYNAGGVCSAFGSGGYATVYYFNGKGTTGIIRSGSTNATQAISGYTAGSNITVTNFNSQNITINGKVTSFSGTVTPMTGSSTLKLFTYSVGTLTTPIYYFNYQSSTKDYQYKPEIQPDNTVKMVDQISGNIPTHVGEFEPVYDVDANDGDCLIDGRFSKVAPSGVVTGGSCLVNGDAYFRDRKDVTEVTGNFGNLTNMYYMFYGCSGITNVSASFPTVTILYGAFWGTSIPTWDIPLPNVTSAAFSFRSSKITEWTTNLPSATTTGWMFLSCRELVKFEADISNVEIISSMFTSCAKLTNVMFINGLPNLTTAANTFDFCTTLSLSVIDNIIDALPTHTTARNIGFQNVKMTQVQYDGFVAKGWTPIGAVIS